jgi:hypothetical protein
MSYTIPEIATLRAADKLAQVKKTAVSTFSGTTTLWAVSNGTNDVTYENTVKGQTLTDIDTKMYNVGQYCINWFSIHDQYFIKMGYLRFSDWLDKRHLRVDEDCATVSYESYGGTRMSNKFVFPSQEEKNKLAQYTVAAGTTGSGCTGLASGAYPTRFCIMSGTGLNGNPGTISGTCVSSGSGATYNFSVTSYVNDGTPDYIGGVGITGISGDGKYIYTSYLSPSGFYSGGYCFLDSHSGTEPRNTEYLYIRNIATSGTYSGVIDISGTPAVHSYWYTSGQLYPCFSGVTAFYAASGTATTGQLWVLPANDRTPSLNPSVSY